MTDIIKLFSDNINIPKGTTAYKCVQWIIDNTSFQLVQSRSDQNGAYVEFQSDTTNAKFNLAWDWGGLMSVHSFDTKGFCAWLEEKYGKQKITEKNQLDWIKNNLNGV